MTPRTSRALSILERHHRAVTTTGGAMVVVGVLQVSGVRTSPMNDLQTRFGGTDLPL